MDVREFLLELNTNKPKFFVMYCSESELRPIYINKFVEAHGGKLTYKESLDIGKQPRMIGKKPVYVIVDWEPGIKKPSSKYMNVNYPVLLVYTKKGEPSEAVKQAYPKNWVVIPEVTGEQATNLLKKEGIPPMIIEFLKEKTSGTQEAILLGKQCVELANDIGATVSNCFDMYYRKGLIDRNIDEEPTDFLQALLFDRYSSAFSYLLSQRGNELFVYAALLNWIEDIIKVCSCKGNFWEDAGLVAAKYKPLQQVGVNRIPYTVWIRLYEEGLRSYQSIKINESDPGTALEVFVCRIIQTMLVIKPGGAATVTDF